MENGLSVGEYLLLELKQIGVTRVFGIPGDKIIKLFKLVENDADLSLTTFSHEPAVGFAAVAATKPLESQLFQLLLMGWALLT